MNRLPAILAFVVFSASVGIIVVTTLALNQLAQQQQIVAAAASEPVDLKRLERWLLSQGLPNDKVLIVVDQFRSGTKSVAALERHNVALSAAIAGPIKAGRLLALVIAICVIVQRLIQQRRQRVKVATGD